MNPLDRIAEARLQEAVERGELDDNPLAGRPLPLEDDSAVAPELRAAYRILKNAGYVPEEVELRKSALRLGDLIAACEDDGERRELQRRRTAELLKLELLLERRGRTAAHGRYDAALRRRLG